MTLLSLPHGGTQGAWNTVKENCSAVTVTLLSHTQTPSPRPQLRSGRFITPFSMSEAVWISRNMEQLSVKTPDGSLIKGVRRSITLDLPGLPRRPWHASPLLSLLPTLRALALLLPHSIQNEERHHSVNNDQTSMQKKFLKIRDQSQLLSLPAVWILTIILSKQQIPGIFIVLYVREDVGHVYLYPLQKPRWTGTLPVEWTQFDANNYLFSRYIKWSWHWKLLLNSVLGNGTNLNSVNSWISVGVC